MTTLIALIFATYHATLIADQGSFRDSQGAVVILHGVNVASDAKVPPFRPIKDLTIFSRLRQAGFNVVRQVFIWEAYQPDANYKDKSYIAYIQHMIQVAYAAGIYTIVDFHQDGLSRVLLQGCGDGFPSWALSTSLPRSTPKNDASCNTWSILTLMDIHIKEAWDSFYANEDHSRDAYIQMTADVAQQLKDTPGLIGYDMLNEPWGKETTSLKDLYNDVGRAIRHVDGNAILFTAPHAMVNFGMPSELPKPDLNNVVYAPHYYDPMVIGLKIWLYRSPEDALIEMLHHSQSWQSPLFIGEYGAPADAIFANEYLLALRKTFDKFFISRSQWVLSPNWDPDKQDGWNNENLSIIDQAGHWRNNFSPRPYACRIAGQPLQQNIEQNDLNGFTIDLQWQHDSSKGETILYLPISPQYSNGLKLEIQPQTMSCQHHTYWIACSQDNYNGEAHLKVEYQ